MGWGAAWVTAPLSTSRAALPPGPGSSTSRKPRIWDRVVRSRAVSRAAAGASSGAAAESDRTATVGTAGGPVPCGAMRQTRAPQMARAVRATKPAASRRPTKRGDHGAVRGVRAFGTQGDGRLDAIAHLAQGHEPEGAGGLGQATDAGDHAVDRVLADAAPVPGLVDERVARDHTPRLAGQDQEGAHDLGLERVSLAAVQDLAGGRSHRRRAQGQVRLIGESGSHPRLRGSSGRNRFPVRLRSCPPSR
jgi:hypothetical protein